MIDISIIIFFAAIISILGMFINQAKKLKSSGEIDNQFPSKDLSYENFKLLNVKARKLWLTFIHATAIIASKLWARITHYISSLFHKGVRRVEQQLIKHEKKVATGEAKQSVFLTTIKTYKQEIKKLKGKVEDELPRPRKNTETVAISEKTDNIDESKPE